MDIAEFRARMQKIKREPVEPRITLLRRDQGLATEKKVTVKSEFANHGIPIPSYIPSASASSAHAPVGFPRVAAKPEDVPMANAQADAQVPADEPTFMVHQTAAEIEYVPESALKEGVAMVKTLNSNLKKLELGSRLREEVWVREIESLRNQGAPTTMIAVCGATGAGKSSILNAILDDNIVPTSGMRACTAVVTEIRHHTAKTIEADVSFLSEAEWRQELSILLDDLVDEDGNLKRSTDLRSDAGVAWQKVHAVYPSVSQEQLVRMTIDQIIARDQSIAKILGTTKHVSAKDSKTFAREIGKYIDSKDQKRGDKSKKGKAKEKERKEKEKGKSLIDLLREQNKSKNASLGIGPAAASSKSKKDDSEGPAYWPLIRQVQVMCNANALATGAILVDLPGVADANAARNNIAKDYMKKCDCIWILAPITRAVDDKTARDLLGDAFKMQLMMDGNYDDHAITFIATKCDDISCTEMIQGLGLQNDPELERIEDTIDQCKVDTDEWKEKKAEAESNAKATDQLLKQLRAQLQEYKDHLRALANGESYTPKFTAIATSKKRKAGSDDEVESSDSDSQSDSGSSRGKKRKNKSGDKQGSSKRRKTTSDDDDDDFIVDDDEELVFSDSDTASDKGNGPDSSSDVEDEEDEEEEEEEAETEMATEESLKAKIPEIEDSLKRGRADLAEYRRVRKEAMDAIASSKKKQVRVQREKNAFCSLKRSEFSRDVLKEDFRTGLKNLDDAAAEERDPVNFDPANNIRNYDAIDLPVFTCSSRDYVRLKGQVQGDGDPSCFSNIEDTGIPDLQDWCQHLTVASRERAARSFLTHLKTFLNSVKVYLEGIGGVTEADREALREKWESSIGDDNVNNDDPWNVFNLASSDDALDLPGLAMLANPFAAGGLYTMKHKDLKVNRFGELIGITPRLAKDFAKIVDDCVNDLKQNFQEGLEEKCRIGATNAASGAVETSDTFAASMHWATYRATLRRLGSWRQDLNVELSNPFTRQIASTWAKVFESDLFSGFERSTNEAISKVLKEVEDSAAPGLKERVKGQAELAVDEARFALQNMIKIVRETVNSEQKEISRSLAPHVQNQLTDGYETAMLERGPGSVARQKAVFHGYVDDIKNEMFEGAADVILTRLADAAEAVGKALGDALEQLAAKVEVGVAVLWEGTKDSDPAQVRTRAQVITVVNRIIREVQLWQEAAQAQQAAAGGLP